MTDETLHFIKTINNSIGIKTLFSKIEQQKSHCNIIIYNIFNGYNNSILTFIIGVYHYTTHLQNTQRKVDLLYKIYFMFYKSAIFLA